MSSNEYKLNFISTQISHLASDMLSKTATFPGLSEELEMKRKNEEQGQVLEMTENADSSNMNDSFEKLEEDKDLTNE